MKGVKEFEKALESKSPTGLTKALSRIADELGYQLKPPYTEIRDFRARERSGRFSVKFDAKLHLHYSTLASCREGLLFIIQFGGKALSDTPNPPADELFYAGVVKSVRVYGYGTKWAGRAVTVAQEIMNNLEVPLKKLVNVGPHHFIQQLQDA
jgi:hypothetical protein